MDLLQKKELYKNYLDKLLDNLSNKNERLYDNKVNLDINKYIQKKKFKYKK